MTIKIRAKRIMRRIVKAFIPPSELDYRIREYRQYQKNHSFKCGDTR